MLFSATLGIDYNMTNKSQVVWHQVKLSDGSRVNFLTEKSARAFKDADLPSEYVGAVGLAECGMPFATFSND